MDVIILIPFETMENGHYVFYCMFILTRKGFSLKQEIKVYATCVRSCLMHGSETWPMKVEPELKMNRTEMSTIRWMCGVELNERKKSAELTELLRLEPVSLMNKWRRRIKGQLLIQFTWKNGH